MLLREIPKFWPSQPGKGSPPFLSLGFVWDWECWEAGAAQLALSALLLELWKAPQCCSTELWPWGHVSCSVGSVQGWGCAPGWNIPSLWRRKQPDLAFPGCGQGQALECPQLLALLIRAVLPSPEQPGADLHHLRGRAERVPGERHREPADLHHPHHGGSTGGCPAALSLSSLCPLRAEPSPAPRAGTAQWAPWAGSGSVPCCLPECFQAQIPLTSSISQGAAAAAAAASVCWLLLPWEGAAAAHVGAGQSMQAFPGLWALPGSGSASSPVGWPCGELLQSPVVTGHL